MKITRVGQKPQDRKWVGSCGACHSTAEAIESEMTHVTEDQKDQTYFSWEVCPVCARGDKITGYGGMLFYVVRDTGGQRLGGRE